MLKKHPKNEYIIQFFKLRELMDELLLSNRYIAKRKYVSQISDYGPVVDYFKVLDSSGMLEPVSYTHLDVYKRQSSARTIPPVLSAWMAAQKALIWCGFSSMFASSRK